MDYKDISERIALLTQEIRDLQDMNAQYRKQSEYTRRISRAAHEARELRLFADQGRAVEDDAEENCLTRYNFVRRNPPTIGAVAAGGGFACIQYTTRKGWVGWAAIAAGMVAFYAVAALFRREGHREGYMDGYDAWIRGRHQQSVWD